MANNSYKSSIMLGVKFQKNDIKKEFDELIKELGKNKIVLDIDFKDKTTLQTLEKLSKELKDINKVNFSEVDKSLKNVGKAIENTEDKAKKLHTTLNGGGNFTSADMTVSKLDNVSQKLENVHKKVNDVNKASSVSIQEVGNSIQKTGDSVSSVGNTLTTHITAPLALVGGVVEKISNDFGAQMSRVKAISGATGEEFKKLHDQALQLGADTAFNATQSAEAQEKLASAGFNVNEIMEAMPGNLDLAASSGESLASSSDICASTLRGFGLEASKASHVADVLATNASKTNVGVADTGESMKYIAPVAKAMGLSLEEVTASIGLMANAGIKGSQSGTTLRSALTKLASPSKEANGVMKSIGFNAFDSQGKMLSLSKIVDNLSKSLKGKTDQQKQDAIATIFGQEAMSGMLELISNGSSAIDELTNSYKNCDGSAKEMAKTMQDNAKSAIEQMNGSLETTAIKLGEAVAPSVINIANHIQDLANKFSELPQPVQQSIIETALLAGAIGPVVKVVGTLTNGIGSLVTFGGRLGTTLGIIGNGAKIGGVALGAFSTAGMVATGVAGALAVGVAGAITYQDLLGRKVSTSTDELTTWEKVVNNCTGNVIKSKTELQKAGLVYKDFAEGVSDSFKENIEKATDTYHDFEMTLVGENSGEKITDEGSKKINSAINAMIDGAKSSISKRKGEVQSELSKMFNSKDGISTEEQGVIDESGKASDEKLKKVEEIQTQITGVWEKAIKEHGKLGQEDIAKIKDYLQQVQQIKAEVEAKTTAESDYAKNQFGERLKGISAKDASEEYSKASDELKKKFADARATYKTGMDDMQKMIDEANAKGDKASADHNQKILDDKKKEYNDLINTEKTKRREYLDMLYEKNPSLKGNINEVDGSEFSKADRNSQGDLDKLTQKYKEVAKATEDGMIRVKDASGKWHEIDVTVDQATGNITSAYDRFTGEYGGYSEKFAKDSEVTGDRIRESMEKLQKSLMFNGGGVKLDLDTNSVINASTDELIGKLDTVIKKADGTKVALTDINGTQVKLEFDDKGALKNINDIQDAINGKINGNPAVVNVDVNDKDAMDKFTETENQISNIDGQTPTVTPNAETSQADSSLDTTTQKVDDLNGKEANATVTVDAGDSLSIIDRIKNFFAWITGKHETATVQVDKTGSVDSGDGYATGTDSATQGFHDTAEEGFEILVGKKKRWFNGGEQVLNHKDSVNVLNDLMNGKSNQSDEQAQVIPVETETQQTIQVTPKKTDIYQGKLGNSETLSVNRANTLDKPYEPEVNTDGMSDSEKKAYEAKKKARDEEEKALKDKADKEKQYLDDIGSAWDLNSKSVSSSIKQIELKETELGDNISVSQKMDLLNQKYQAQLSLLPEAEKTLNTYKNTSLTTADGQEELSKKIQEATETFIEQKSAVAEAYNEMQKYEEDSVQKLREALVGGLQKEREKEKEDKLERLDTEYDKKKSRIQSEYDSEKKRIQAEKKQAEKEYEDEIKALQKQISSIEETKENKTGKLAELQKELQQWNNDNSSFGQKNRVELTKQISDLQLDIQKDNVQKQIDSLNEQKDNSSNYYADELSDADEYYSKKLSKAETNYNKEKKSAEKHYKKLLDEKRLYLDADELLTSESNDRMLKILEDSSESYKQVGYLTGKSFKDAFLEEIESAQEALSDLTGGSKGKSSKSSKSSSSKEVKVGDSVKVSNGNGDVIDKLSNGSAVSRSGSLSEYSGDKLKTTGYNNGYFELSKGGQVIGWARRDDIATYESGGRTPSNIPISGATAVLHKDEKILNAEDTVKFDESMLKISGIYEWVKNNSAITAQLSNTLANAGNYSMPALFGTNLNGIASNITNNKTNTSSENKYYTLNNSFNINEASNGGATSKEVVRDLEVMLNRFGANKIRP